MLPAEPVTLVFKMDIDSQSPAAKWSIVRPVRPQDNTDAAARLSHVPITTPGSKIPTEDLSVRARGTLLSVTAKPAGNRPINENASSDKERGKSNPNQTGTAVLTATVAGVVSRVNKLVMVVPLRAKYVAETGDVVVGRVVELTGRRWKLDIHAARNAVLLLSAVNLPGGVQRRRTHEDELNMRSYLKEGDLVSAEVQEQWADGSVALHTRSLRYGKLEAGQFVTVQPELVKRAKKHFHQLPCGVHTILGNNGYIFIAEHVEARYSLSKQNTSSNLQANIVPADVRQKIARVANSILALDTEFIAIGPDTIMDVYETSVQNCVPLKDMLRPDVMKTICSGARSMRDAA